MKKIEDDIWKDFFICCLSMLKLHIKIYSIYLIVYPISILGTLFLLLHFNFNVKILQELSLMYLTILASNISFLFLYHSQDKSSLNLYFWIALIFGFIFFYCIVIYFLSFISILIAPNLTFIYTIFSLIKGDSIVRYRLRYILYGMLFSCVCFLVTILSMVLFSFLLPFPPILN